MNKGFNMRQARTSVIDAIYFALKNEGELPKYEKIKAHSES